MININFDLTVGIAKFAQTTVIKQGAQVPVRVVFSVAPGSVSSIKLALGDDSDAPTVLAYVDTFAAENDTTWSGLLDASDTRLVAFMAGKGPTAVNLELTATIDGVRQVAPNLSLTIQPAIVTGPTSSEGGPSYYTEAEADALLVPLKPAAEQAEIDVSAGVTTTLFAATNFSSVTSKIIAGAGSGAYNADYALPVSGIVRGAIAEVNVELPASANPTIRIFNGTTSGSPLTTANNITGAAAYWYGRFRFNGAAWQCLFRAFQS
jgi:hypothetical protein